MMDDLDAGLMGPPGAAGVGPGGLMDPYGLAGGAGGAGGLAAPAAPKSIVEAIYGWRYPLSEEQKTQERCVRALLGLGREGSSFQPAKYTGAARVGKGWGGTAGDAGVGANGAESPWAARERTGWQLMVAAG